MVASAQPSNAAALEFLQKWKPEGPWLLTAINPDPPASGNLGDKVRSRLLTADRPEMVTQWLENWNGKWNLYFHVNSVMDGVSKKAERTDVKSLDWLHVDVDPREGYDIEEEQTRALGLLRKPPGNIPPPTVIVFSGGGYQGFWKLKEPLVINGDLEKAEGAKLFNLALERAFKADNCHNIDRIMRLPGTINVPNKTKLKKGRERALAELLEFNDNDYGWEHFERAEQKKKNELGGSGNGLGIDDIAPAGPQDIEELKSKYPNVPVKAWVIMVLGYDPDDGPKPDSRSENVFYFCCEMVRNDVPDDVIFSILTDPAYDISESMLDKDKPETYALRQLNRAKEDAVDPHLRALNDEYALIEDLDGKCRIVHEVYDPTTDRTRVAVQQRDDFTLFYGNRTVSVEIVTPKGDIAITQKPLGEWWLKHAQRRSYKTLEFAPNKNDPTVYNLWQGYGCASTPGDCEPFLTHVKDNICAGNEEHYTYLVGWMARTVQQPEKNGQVAIVLKGDRGAGKSVFATEFGKLFGRHFIQVADAKRLTGSFNAHLRDSVVVFSDEALYAGDKRHEGVLKTLITEDSLSIEPKGREVKSVANCVHLIIASNEDWAVPAGALERRYLVLGVSSAKLQDSEYFRALKDQLNSGGREALLSYLSNYDLSEYNVRAVPKTEGLQEQVERSLNDFEDWWLARLKDGSQYEDGSAWESKMNFSRMVNDFANYRTKWKKSSNESGRPNHLSRFLKKLYPTITSNKRKEAKFNEQGMRDGTKSVTVYVMPSLEECRAGWDKAYGGSRKWPELEEEGEAELQDIPF